MGWSTGAPNAVQEALPSYICHTLSLSHIQVVFKPWQCSSDYWMNINPLAIALFLAWKTQAVPEEPLTHFFLSSKSSARVNKCEERACMAYTLLLNFCSNIKTTAQNNFQRFTEAKCKMLSLFPPIRYSPSQENTTLIPVEQFLPQTWQRILRLQVWAYILYGLSETFWRAVKNQTKPPPTKTKKPTTQTPPPINPNKTPLFKQYVNLRHCIKY